MDNPPSSPINDLIIIGGGIVGLATAYTILLRKPGLNLTVLEKEPAVAVHQTGRNSGVIHSGIYYRPGSIKAQTCRRGITLLEDFCNQHEIPWERCGKIIVAINKEEAAWLDDLHNRGLANGVNCTPLTAEQIREREPHCAGIRGLFVADTGIVDYAAVCHALVAEIHLRGGSVITAAKVHQIETIHQPLRIVTQAGQVFQTRQLVTCAGLHADRVAHLTGVRPAARIVPFRGEYYELRPAARHFVSHLIYPVPDPAFPFLGVHFTRMINQDSDGYQVECGPNAVLALAREGYTNTSINIRDLWDTLTYPAFWKMASSYWRTGMGEIHRSFSKQAFVRALQRLIPEITAADLIPAPAGVRAQALGRDGKLHDDFVIETAAQHRTIDPVSST
jgi:L-2-hydroxyglutarate oxidase